MLLRTGECRICKCTEMKPCVLTVDETGEIFNCAWYDANRTLCDNMRCVASVPLRELEAMERAFPTD